MLQLIKKKFKFNISLSVLNHLGRSLYRNFTTVIGEAISNSWDADAENVWIYINQDNRTLVIKDDGIGMNREDFQNKFLKIGYSKRKNSKNNKSFDKKRPFIGRKGIGKLALLSCAERISIISRTDSSEKYVGGVIDNSGLDNAIKRDLEVDKYPLEEVDMKLLGEYIKGHKKGTIIYFENLKDGVLYKTDHLRKIIALYFRFSLYDDTFSIYVNDEKISINDLSKLIDNTQFLWEFGQNNDPLIHKLEDKVLEKNIIDINKEQIRVNGFIASVKKPSDLNIFSVGEKVGVDLFVNGRLREKDILKHIPSSRVVESYIYGQMHFDVLDDGNSKEDRFTSSREGVAANDELFNKLLDYMKEQLKIIFDQWDEWRLKYRQSGDIENNRKTKKQRASADLYNETVNEYIKPRASTNKTCIVKKWSDELANDAEFNIASYTECFIAENLVRKYIKYKKIPIQDRQKDNIKKYKEKECKKKQRGNISIDIRSNNDELQYLGMHDLVNLVEPTQPGTQETLTRDSNEYTPIRDAFMHTSCLTIEAKTKLTSIYYNIKSKIAQMLER